MFGRRDLRCAACVDFYGVQADTFFFDNHAGVPAQSGRYGGGDSDSNVVREAFEEIYQPV